MSLWTYRRSSAFKRPSDIVLRWSDLTNPRAELTLARSTDAVVTGVTSSSFRTCRTFGNKSSCPETLVFSFFSYFFFLPARGGGASPSLGRPPPPLDPLLRIACLRVWGSLGSPEGRRPSGDPSDQKNNAATRNNHLSSI